MAVVSWDKCCGDVSFQTSTHERQAGAPRRACVSPRVCHGASVPSRSPFVPDVLDVLTISRDFSD